MIDGWKDVPAEALSEEALANLQLWLEDEEYAPFRDEILGLIQSGDYATLEDSFYTTLPFGTGGRRGPRGVGPNRINERTIAESARGLANWVARSGDEAKRRGIAIAYDTRIKSDEFTRICARAIASTGVKVHLFDSPRPTPVLSFSVRHVGAQAGIVVSASHNPPTDNGFKAYGPDGGQLLPPDDTAVMDEVAQLASGLIPLMDFDEGRNRGMIRILGSEVDEAYQDALARVPCSSARNVRIVFTPLHGTGGNTVLPGLRRAGFMDVHEVSAQSFPSGEFPNVINQIPNPEVPTALQQAKETASALGADIALATDPDADRLGCVARHNGDLSIITGNQIAVLLTHHILEQRQKQGRLNPDLLVVTTAVTTRLIRRIAEHFGVGVIDNLLVGFKHIACVMRNLDDPNRFVFGTEESHGYLAKPEVRDKDGADAALLLAEAAAEAKAACSDLFAALDDIYRRFGYHKELQENYIRPGKTGKEEIGRILDGLRANPPHEIAGIKVTEIVDRLSDEIRKPDGTVIGEFEPAKNPKTGKVIEQLTLAKDNLLIFNLENDSGFVAVRPSGTEPKCKFYVAANADVPPGADLESIKHQVGSTAARLRKDLLRRVDRYV